MSEMRIMTVRQPWAWAIIHGGKNVENRVRNIAGAYRGPVAIHVAKTEDRFPLHGPIWDAATAAVEAGGGDTHERVFTWDLGTPDPRRWLYDHGHITGVVDLVDVHLVQQSHAGTNVCFDNTTPVGDICSQWAHAYDEFPAYRGHHLVLRDPRPIVEPILFKGALGLRRLNEAMVQRIEAAIA